MKLIETYNEENLFKTKFTGSGMVILSLLVLALLGLGERALYDLARTLAGPIGNFGYFDNPQVITIHAFFVVFLLILSILINYIFGRRREKYALVLIPYFVTSIILAVQLALQLGVFFTNHHNNLQFYLVMSLLVIVSSYAIFHIQNNYKREDGTKQNNLIGLFVAFIVIFAIFAVLILSFNNGKIAPNIDPYSRPNPPVPQNVSYPINNSTPSVPQNIFYPTEQQNSPVDTSNIKNTADPTSPRIALWSGAVNQYWDLNSQKWVVDPQPVGADVDKLSYCQKWYPGTKKVEQFASETLPAYYNGLYQDKGPYNPNIYDCVN